MSKTIVDEIRSKMKKDPEDFNQPMHDDSCPACGRRDDFLSQDGQQEEFPEKAYNSGSVDHEVKSTDNNKRLSAIMGKISRMKK